MKRRVKALRRKVEKTQPSSQVRWARGYCIPRLEFADESLCATLRQGVKMEEAKPEDYIITRRKLTPDEAAEREADRADDAAMAREALCAHAALFEGNARGDNHSLGLLLLALRDEAKAGNRSAPSALCFLAREVTRILKHLGMAGDLVELARDSAEWLRGWAEAAENASALREIAQWKLSWPINMPRPRNVKKLSGEVAEAIAFVAGLNLGSGLHPVVRGARPHGKPKGSARWKGPFTRDCRDILNQITQLREISGTRFEGCPVLEDRNTSIDFYTKELVRHLSRHPLYRDEGPKKLEDNARSFILNLFDKRPE